MRNRDVIHIGGRFKPFHRRSKVGTEIIGSPLGGGGGVTSSRPARAENSIPPTDCFSKWAYSGLTGIAWNRKPTGFKGVHANASVARVLKPRPWPQANVLRNGISSAAACVVCNDSISNQQNTVIVLRFGHGAGTNGGDQARLFGVSQVTVVRNAEI